MNERSYTFEDTDRTGWPSGPWDDEPDKIVWVDDDTGLDCMIVRNRTGGLCGYVGVPEGHPWFEKGYDDVSAEVHGGLTFADHCSPGKREDEQGICHNPQGRPDNVWWLGFDCVHAWDLAPGLMQYGVVRMSREDVYRDVAYVKAEIASLAGQAVAAAK